MEIRYVADSFPMGMIRRLELGDPPIRSIWFRAVTWAQNQSERSLIGNCKILEDTAATVWK